jgi:DNA polymerase III subunit beta
MKFTVGTSDLQRILGKLGGVIPSKSPMPILETFLFELVNNVLSITATDQIISSTITLEVKGEQDGKIAIPAKRLTDTIRSLPVTEAVFVIDVVANKIKISTPTGEYSLSGESAKEYPEVPEFVATATTTLDSSILRKIVHRTAFAVSSDELRPSMMGILLQANGTEIRAVATDGHRLSRFVYRPEKGAKLAKDVIVPAKALGILVKGLETGPCTVSTSNTYVKFTYDQTVLMSRLIEETYPNYEVVIPKENNKLLTIKREDLINAIRRVSLFANASNHQVRFDLAAGNLKLSAQDADAGGEAHESLPCTYDVDPMEIGFNATYLMDILAHIDSEQVTMKFSAPTRAGIVYPADAPENEDTLMLIMPVRLTVPEH